MEIERKFLIKELPENLEAFEHHEIEQGYLCTEPVLRVRKKDDNYFFTYKGKGLLAREEVETSINKEAYDHLIKKADGYIISKTRYIIPFKEHTIELDIFHKDIEGLIMAEVEFESVEIANAFTPPEWFGKDVTDDNRYHNSNMSKNGFHA